MVYNKTVTSRHACSTYVSNLNAALKCLFYCNVHKYYSVQVI